MSTDFQSPSPELRPLPVELHVAPESELQLAPEHRGWRELLVAQRAQALRFLRFLVVGGLASAVYLGLTALFMLTGVYYMYAAGAALLIAIATNFTVNRQWTFNGRGVRRIHVQAISFLGVQLAVGALNLALLNGMVVLAGITPVIVAQIVVAGLLAPVNFLASQRWGFR